MLLVRLAKRIKVKYNQIKERINAIDQKKKKKSNIGNASSSHACDTLQSCNVIILYMTRLIQEVFSSRLKSKLEWKSK